MTKNGQKTNYNLQNTTQKTKDQTNPRKNREEPMCSGKEGYTIPAPLVVPILLISDTNMMWYGNRIGHQYT